MELCDRLSIAYNQIVNRIPPPPPQILIKSSILSQSHYTVLEKNQVTGLSSRVKLTGNFFIRYASGLEH